jgi:hypothetical protein
MIIYELTERDRIRGSDHNNCMSGWLVLITWLFEFLLLSGPSNPWFGSLIVEIIFTYRAAMVTIVS